MIKISKMDGRKMVKEIESIFGSIFEQKKDEDEIREKELANNNKNKDDNGKEDEERIEDICMKSVLAKQQILLKIGEIIDLKGFIEKIEEKIDKIIGNLLISNFRMI